MTDWLAGWLTDCSRLSKTRFDCQLEIAMLLPPGPRSHLQESISGKWESSYLIPFPFWQVSTHTHTHTHRLISRHLFIASRFFLGFSPVCAPGSGAGQMPKCCIYQRRFIGVVVAAAAAAAAALGMPISVFLCWYLLCRCWHPGSHFHF